MKKLKHMKNCLKDIVMCQMADLKNVDTKELGEAIDMIKDLYEAMYYCAITEAMEDKKHYEHGEGDEHEPKIRDPKEGRSYMSRRLYLEAKEMGRDKLSSIQDLDHYVSELTDDIMEMIESSSMEEKQLLQKKLNMLAQKVVSNG